MAGGSLRRPHLVEPSLRAGGPATRSPQVELSATAGRPPTRPSAVKLTSSTGGRPSVRSRRRPPPVTDVLVCTPHRVRRFPPGSRRRTRRLSLGRSAAARHTPIHRAGTPTSRR